MLVLRYGTSRMSVFELAKTIGPVFSEALVSNVPTGVFIPTLRQQIYLSVTQTHTVAGIYELLLRQRKSQHPLEPFLTKPSTIAEHFYWLQSKKQEHIYALYLTPRLQLVKKVLLAKGTTDKVMFDITDALYFGIKYRTRKFVILHNHPSGSSKPSEEDVSLTLRISSAANLLSMSLIDHIIVGNGNYYSFKEEGRVL